MPSGGALTIETSNVVLDEAEADGEEAKPGPYVVVAVTDTGTGMEKDVLQKAVEPFFTTKGVGKGSGLGLSQVYGFVRQSGGHLRIDSQPGQGTSVKLYLPRLAAAQEPDEAGGERRATPGAVVGGTILVVEDEEDVRAQVVAVLRDAGYTVLEASDAPSALRILDAQPSVHLLFTDVGLPGGMNGRDLAGQARLRRPGLRVLFTSGYAREAIVHHGRLDPDLELIGKPFTSAELTDKVHRMLAEAPAEGRVAMRAARSG
jgi:CheY-like chemotaxis protein